MHFLIFLLRYDRDSGLDRGSLTLNHLEDGFLQVWQATSSMADKQKKDEQFKTSDPAPFQGARERASWGELLPANKDTQTKRYSVVLDPVYLSDNKEVAGNFYQIKPYVIKTINGKYRSDVGIHLDGLVSGSLGCIVMNKLEFDEFEQYMDDLRKRRIKEIPLFVQYT